MNVYRKSAGTGLAVALLFGLSVVAAQAGISQDVGDGSYSLGVGLRASYNSVEDGAPSGADRSNDFNLETLRLYGSGSLNDYISFEGNVDATEDDVKLLDAVVKVKLNDLFEVWGGRFLPPSDRSNLSGPYFLNAWTFPIAQKYPAIFAGRDNGVAVWGQTGGGAFKYQVGAFEGSQGVNNDEDNPLFAGRLTLNLWDPEPGYYNSSTYYGSKDVLAIGLVAMSQSDGAGDGISGGTGDFNGWNIDVLAEKNLEMGVATLEGAFYDYDSDGATGGTAEGDGFFVLASWLCPETSSIGPLEGKWQPMFRWQEYENEADTDATELWELGVNYIMDGHNSRMSLVFGEEDPAGTGDSFNSVRLGMQIQI
ncbi:MAG: porin [bacterium]